MTSTHFSQFRSELESSKAELLSTAVIADFLYGHEDGSELLPSMDDIKQSAELRKWSSYQWADLLKTYSRFF